MAVKAIVFDLDNTLIDFMQMKRKASEAAISAMIKAGVKIDKERAEEILNRLFKKYGMEYQKIFDELLKEITGQVDLRILAAAVVAYRRVKGDLLEPYPNVIPVLTKLKKKVTTLGVVSDAPKFQAWTRLYEMKLDKFFDFVVAWEDTNNLKSSGLPFQKVLEKLKMKPEEILVVGDRVSRDILPAKNLGMKTVLARYGMVIKEEGQADYEINDISELLKLV